MKNNLKLKKRNSRKENTIFKIDNTNNGQIDLEQFRDDSRSINSRKSSNKKSRFRNSDKFRDSSDSQHGNKSSRNKDKDKDKNTQKYNTKISKTKRNIGSESFEKESVGLRVVGGKFRGSSLAYAGDNRVRPMKDRVREAVFNLIGPEVRGKHVIDLFGGTGALAIEAISRGAAAATIIEMHLPTATMLRKNLESLNLIESCCLCKTDAFFWAKNKTVHPLDGNAWIVFCSPPYSFYAERENEILEMLDNLLVSAPIGSIFVIESDNRFDFSHLPIQPAENKIRSYPPAEIAVFFKKSEIQHGGETIVDNNADNNTPYAIN
ncbi:MAG: RsmD family RNA methyltransferase [Planctomycetaceae bacterium]|jgi:16S rRNA (guanine(966)-N(2))-methyltransferase RsmD|nr:RsmD family RNA methyltransferase [Planctomycetaceae bacterium]